MTGLDRTQTPKTRPMTKRTALVADAQIHVYWIFSGLLHWWRVWRESDNQPIDDWSVGLGVNISL